MFEEFEYEFDFNNMQNINAVKLSIAIAFKDKYSTCSLEMNTSNLNPKTQKMIK